VSDPTLALVLLLEARPGGRSRPACRCRCDRVLRRRLTRDLTADQGRFWWRLRSTCRHDSGGGRASRRDVTSSGPPSGHHARDCAAVLGAVKASSLRSDAAFRGAPDLDCACAQRTTWQLRDGC